MQIISVANDIKLRKVELCTLKHTHSNSYHIFSACQGVNTLRPRQDGRHLADDIFMCILFNENCCILIKFSLKYVRKGQIDNNPTLVQIMAWRRSGNKPLYEPMSISLPTHICVTGPQWVKMLFCNKVVIKTCPVGQGWVLQGCQIYTVLLIKSKWRVLKI